jgi:hypothetical protein
MLQERKQVRRCPYVQVVVLMAVGVAASYNHTVAQSADILRAQGVGQELASVILKSTKVGQIVTPVASPWVTPILFAYLLLFVSIFLNVPVRFGKLFSLAMWSFVPFVGLRFLVQQALYALLGGTSVDLSLAVFLPEGSSRILHGLAGQIDPFYLWSLGLLAVGYSTMLKRPLRDGLVCSGVALAIRTGVTIFALA